MSIFLVSSPESKLLVPTTSIDLSKFHFVESYQ